MRYSPKQFDVIFEVDFAAPCVDLACNAGGILKAFADVVAPRYQLRSSDLRAYGSAVLSEARVICDLFNGLGRFEINPDRFSATFRNAVGTQDIEVIKDSITLGMEALQASLPNIRILQESVRLSSWLELSAAGEETTASDFLRKLVALEAYETELAPLRAEVLPGVKLELFGGEEKYRVTFDVTPAWGDDKTLFLALYAVYFQENRFQSVEAKADHVQTCLEYFLDALGLKENTHV